MNNVKEFLEEYNGLVKKHGVYIASELKFLSKNLCCSKLKVVFDDECEFFESDIEWCHNEQKWVEEE